MDDLTIKKLQLVFEKAGMDQIKIKRNREFKIPDWMNGKNPSESANILKRAFSFKANNTFAGKYSFAFAFE